MVVVCPKCKTRLKVDENKIKVEGSRFKCPRCRTILLVKKPAAPPKKTLDKNKILVAHPNASTTNEITSILTQNGFHTITSVDGIDAMIKATKELPFLTIVDVGLPKIFGFEVCKRLRQRAETKEMKFIFIGSIYDKKRYIREPESLHGADDYVDEQHIAESLVEKVVRYLSGIGYPEVETAGRIVENVQFSVPPELALAARDRESQISKPKGKSL